MSFGPMLIWDTLSQRFQKKKSTDQNLVVLNLMVVLLLVRKQSRSIVWTNKNYFYHALPSQPMFSLWEHVMLKRQKGTFGTYCESPFCLVSHGCPERWGYSSHTASEQELVCHVVG